MTIQMEGDDDDDLKLQRASASAITEIKHGIARVAAGIGIDDINASSSSRADFNVTIKRIIVLVNLFQEDPQLLDPHLKDMLPPLVTCFVKLTRKKSYSQVLGYLAEMFYTFCKVRGHKVVTRFFDNEPKNIQPILTLLLEDLTATQYARTVTSTTTMSDHNDIKEIPDQSSLTWELRYILMLWIAYLLLTPFDLESISGGASSNTSMHIKLPELIPGVALDVVNIATELLGAPTKEQHAAATALVKLALRPDMRILGVLDSLLTWSLSIFSEEEGRHESLNVMNGALLVLSGIVSTADIDEIITHLPAIYKTIARMFGAETNGLEELWSSAISKKLSIKIQRNIITQLLRTNNSGSPNSMTICHELLFDMGALENVIDSLLQSLKDRETLVRYAASKALSVITSIMDAEMAEEVVEAIIGPFGEHVLMQGQTKDVSDVNASYWHGLTLTLSHLLFRRSPIPSQLPRILDILYDTLKFEQRSTIGNSIGANVRDAANFGLWSLARRYTTEELLDVVLSSNVGGASSLSAIQLSACNLVVAACLDPAGNVRRGSSAALQELIGRHPNTIHEGISLVQIVDYHAVGLRGRAMIDVAAKASNTGDIYRSVLLEGLYGWRGVQTPDRSSRTFAARSIGHLANLHPDEEITKYTDAIVAKLAHIPTKDVEWRSGLIMALAEVMNRRDEYARRFTSQESGSADDRERAFQDLNELSNLWALFEENRPISLNRQDFNAFSSRAHLMRLAIILLVTAISTCSLHVIGYAGKDYSPPEPGKATIEIFTMCLDSKDSLTLEAIPPACAKLGIVLSQPRRMEIVQGWIQQYNQTSPQKAFGLLTALASIWTTIPSGNSSSSQAHDIQTVILDILLSATSNTDIETRVLAVRNLVIIVDSSSSDSTAASTLAPETILEAFETALNDYTINERGDVGSLVRLEALIAIEHVWERGLWKQSPRRVACYRSAQRLALERLDKVRLAAAKCLVHITRNENASIPALPDISTYKHFLATSTALLYQSTNCPLDLIENHITFLLGISSTAGAGSESLAHTARAVLHDIFCSLALTHVLPPSSQSDHLTTDQLPVTLHTLATALLTLLTRALTSDRILLPLLDTFTFLLDCNLLQPLGRQQPQPSSQRGQGKESETGQGFFKWRTLLSTLQKSHFKSTNQQKLLAAVQVYRGLSDVEAIRGLVLEKLVGMLAGNAFPKVRAAVAETLWVITRDEALKQSVWSAPVRENREVVEGFRRRWCGG